MKKIFNSIKDRIREILQIISLILCLVLPSIMNLSETLSSIFKYDNPSIESVISYYLMRAGNKFIGIALMFFVLFKIIRKSNKENILNKGNIYHDYYYFWYWFCSYILGYEKCNLILVPIHMQMKLVVRDTFKYFPIDDRDFPCGNDQVCIKIFNEEKDKKNMNLILEDTYFINSKQINEKVLSNYTVKISRKIENIGLRTYSRKFVDEVITYIRKLPEDTRVNIFATINPKHSFEISKDGLRLANRGNLKHVYVYQQENYSGKRKFEKEYKIF